MVYVKVSPRFRILLADSNIRTERCVPCQILIPNRCQNIFLMSSGPKTLICYLDQVSQSGIKVYVVLVNISSTVYATAVFHRLYGQAIHLSQLVLDEPNSSPPLRVKLQSYLITLRAVIINNVVYDIIYIQSIRILDVAVAHSVYAHAYYFIIFP